MFLVITPASPAPGVCTPGQGEGHSSLLAELVCGTWLPEGPAEWAHLADRWPYAAIVAAVLVGIVVAWRGIRRAAWARLMRDASWLEITPPVSVTHDHMARLWLLLLESLKAPGRFTLHPKRLIFEVHATPTRTRLGICVPGNIEPGTVTRIIKRAWRDATVSQAAMPRLPSALPVAGQQLGLRQPDWLPLLDEPDRASDGLQPVFDALAGAGRGAAGLLQVAVCRAPRRRTKVFALAGRDPIKAARRNAGTVKLVDFATRGIRAVLLGVLDLIQTSVRNSTPGTRSTSKASPLADPYQAERARLARGKGAKGPHLLLGVRMFASATSPGGARANTNDISGSYPAVSTAFTRRRVWRPGTAVHARWIPETSMFLATVPETAAIAGIPTEPVTFGLPAASARRRPGTPDTFRITSRTATHDPDKPYPATQSGDDQDPWSVA